MYFKINFGVSETRTWRSRICHVRSNLRKYFFRLPFESRGFKHYILQISSRQLLLWTSTKSLKNGFKNRWFFCKKFQHVCLIISMLNLININFNYMSMKPRPCRLFFKKSLLKNIMPFLRNWGRPNRYTIV